MADIFMDNGGTEKLSLRERFGRVMHFQKVDRIPFFEFGYWKETLPRWHGEGLPGEIDNEQKAYEYFGIENWAGVPVSVRIFPGPVFEAGVIEEDEKHIVKREEDGSVVRIKKDGSSSIPQHLSYPLKDRKDWEKFKVHLDPHAKGRISEDFYKNLKAYKERDYVLTVPIGSMIGIPRDWIGFESIGLMAYDNPKLLHDIIETLCGVVEVVLEEICRHVRFDWAFGWEDICFNSGPIISPRMFDEFVVPRYRRITSILHKNGVDVVAIDCDGNVMPILDGFLKGGINCMFPAEVNGGTDPVKVRGQYGKKVLMTGGVDKLKLAKDKKIIEAELKRLEPVVREGGFIPFVDHRVPPTVSLENYKFYLKVKRQMFRAGYRKPQYKE